MSSWKPECIGGVSQLQTSTLQPTEPNKGGPPSTSPTTQWEAWVQANYGSDTPAPVVAQDRGEEATDGDSTTELSGQPLMEAATDDPFSWSGGAFDGETYYDSDSAWWDQGGMSAAESNLHISVSTAAAFVCFLLLAI